MKIRYRNDEDFNEPYLNRPAACLSSERPIADEIHDGEGNRQNAQESYEEFEEIPIERVDHGFFYILDSADFW